MEVRVELDAQWAVSVSEALQKWPFPSPLVSVFQGNVPITLLPHDPHTVDYEDFSP